MRYLVISDVHGDLVALEAVLAHAGPVDQVLFLGDAVDFGPEPEESVIRLRAVASVWVRGNHDEDVAVGESGDGWSAGQLSPASRAALSDLPERVEVDGATLRHFVRPELLPPRPGDFDGFATPVCFVGHTHVPFLYLRGTDGDRRIVEPTPGQPIDVAGQRAIANPGSVGSSFVDPNVASYLVYDTDGGRATLTWGSAPRSAASVVARLRGIGAPDELQESSQLFADGRLSFMIEIAAAHRAWAAALP
jgi:predicted phosphodiesterase